ncbi:hypothetical protein R3P38DRAFT_3257632 [Favolaschia claudopus]|uniref:F-box domain-containing protein n=1 Tax=Favolaschia claudopus TaxID=2862362 RepID=A0AAW0DCM2_9AGAR
MVNIPSVAELRERIDDLSSAIEAQEHILRGLVTQQSDARRQLNFLLDPMARIPFELQSDIFLQSLPEHPGCFAYAGDVPLPALDSPPLNLIGVSRLWRDIALATPKLWAEVVMESLPRGSKYSDLCRIWLNRAKGLPLSLTLGGSLKLEKSVLDLVGQYRHQLENLSLILPLDELLDVPYPIMQFNVDKVSPLSSLKTLTLEATCTEEMTNVTIMDRWLDILRAAPELQSCVLDQVWFEDGNDLLEPLTLASLHELRLGQPYSWVMVGNSASSCVMLRYLTLPRLKSLALSIVDIENEDLFDFLSRSSPHLESLALAVPEEWDDTVVTSLLALMPTLSNLKLCVPPKDIARYTPFLDILGTARDTLPNLRNIEFWTDFPLTIDYDKVLRMLDFRYTACRTPLESFALVFGWQMRDFSSDLPNEQVRAGMRQLVKNGLGLRLGPLSGNSI